jgi:hypothetical protein
LPLETFRISPRHPGADSDSKPGIKTCLIWNRDCRRATTVCPAPGRWRRCGRCLLRRGTWTALPP